MRRQWHSTAGVGRVKAGRLLEQLWHLPAHLPLLGLSQVSLQWNPPPPPPPPRCTRTRVHMHARMCDMYTGHPLPSV